MTKQDIAIKKLQEIKKFRFGLILFAGSTGSGKRTTMFTILQSLKDKRIYTLEDPIERHYSLCMQLAINDKQGLTFQSGIAHLLRHDPDVIVIGEIRDKETAKAAISAAYTGHLVVSTIHSSSTKHTIGRLMDCGVSIYDIKQVVQLIVYQHLIIDQSKQKRSANYEFLQADQIAQHC